MNFSEALEEIKHGYRVARRGWNGKGMFLFLIRGHDIITHFDVDYDFRPFVAIKDVENKVTPWLCSQTDLLAEDWQIVED